MDFLVCTAEDHCQLPDLLADSVCIRPGVHVHVHDLHVYKS